MCFSLLQQHGIASKKNYHYGVNMTWSSNRTEVSEEELFDQATASFGDLFETVYFRFFKAGRDGRFNVKYKDLGNSSISQRLWVREQRHRAFGKCYTLTPEPWMRRLGIYYLRLQT